MVNIYDLAIEEYWRYGPVSSAYLSLDLDLHIYGFKVPLPLVEQLRP